MKNGIRVLRLTPYFYFEVDEDITTLDLDYEPLGGMQVQIMEQTRAISKLCGAQVVLTTGLPKIPRRYVFTPNTSVISVRLPTPAIRSQSKGRLFLLPSWALGTILWSIKCKLSRTCEFDIIHHHTSDLLGSFVSAPIVAWILGKPLVLTIHCSPNFTFNPSTDTEKVLFKLSKIFERWVVSQADYVYTLTERTSLLYKEAGLSPKSKIKVIPDGVNIEVFHKVNSSREARFRKDFALPEHNIIVSYIGRIAPEKGWGTFLEMATILQKHGIHYLVCGDGYTRNEFETQVKHLGLSDRFTFTGYIAHERIAEALSISNFLIVPSHHEEFGGVILEAMACGTPVIASNVGGIPYTVIDNVTGFLVSPNNPSKLSEKVIWGLSNKTDVNRVSKNALEYVVNRYSIQTVASQVVKGYECAMGEL